MIAVKRIFQTLSSKVPPDSLTSTDGDETMLVDEKEDGISKAEPSSIKNPIAEPIVSPASIAQFLLAHPSPLTETELEPLVITYDDFLAALPTIQPSVKREGFTTIPEVTWDDVGGAHEIRSELHISITQPILNPALFKAAGITAPSGVLLWGPPGCGKTHLAKAVANESQANFISVKGPELLNKVYIHFALIASCSCSSISPESTLARVKEPFVKYSLEHERRPLVLFFLTNLMH